jgi:hypothetical protein
MANAQFSDSMIVATTANKMAFAHDFNGRRLLWFWNKATEAD